MSRLMTEVLNVDHYVRVTARFITGCRKCEKTIERATDCYYDHRSKPDAPSGTHICEPCEEELFREKLEEESCAN